MNLELQSKRTYTDSMIVFLIFMFGVAVHLILHMTVFDFSRAIRVYPDELRYYDIARSLFNGDGLSIRNLPSDFQKIAYSLVIMPFFAIQDTVFRLKAIGAGNIVIMNLSVIFMWLICSELQLNRRTKCCIAFFTAIWPDMMYSMTYMSEVLYWPLTVIFLYLWLVNERRQSYILAVILGFLCYFMYLTKEIALSFILAYVSYVIIYPVLNYMLADDRKNRTLKEFFSKRKFMLLCAFIVAFVICYTVVKMTFFSGLGNSYNQTGLKAIMSPYNFMYMIYAFFYYVASILVASLIIPAVFPVINFRFMNENSRKLFCYVILWGLVTSAAVVYTVAGRYNLGYVAPEISLRYYGSFFVVLLAIFFSSMQNMNSENIFRTRRFSAEILSLAVIYICFMFNGIDRSSTVTQYILLWYLAIERVTGILFPPAGQWKVFYPSAVITGIFMISLAVLFYRTYTYRSKERAQKFFAALLFVITLGLNAAAGTLIDYAYHADTETVNEVISINKYFADDSTSNIIYLNYNAPLNRYDRFNRYIDTYMERRHHFYIMAWTSINPVLNGGIVNAANVALKAETGIMNAETNIYDEAEVNINRIDYIILENSDSAGQNKPVNVEPVKELCGKHFTVYKNLNPSVIQFEN